MRDDELLDTLYEALGRRHPRSRRHGRRSTSAEVAEICRRYGVSLRGQLHDCLGHHLVGLIVSLQVASRAPPEEGRANIDETHLVAKLLFREVRDTVSALRSGGEVDLRGAVQRLAEGVDTPTIQLSYEPELTVGDSSLAHALDRGAQEIITNAIKHSGARNLWITVRKDDSGIRLEAPDDGQGAEDDVAGNGLKGMRERVEQVGGRLTVESKPNAGFRVVRHGIRSLIGTTDDIEVVAEAADGAEALEQIPLTKPDCVLLDIQLPKLSGIEVLRRLARVMDVPPTILLTTFDDDEALLKGIRAGAKGHLLKDVSIEQLADSIRRVVAGETRIRPAITERASRVLEAMDSRFDRLDLPDPLTKREAQILSMMAGGFSNREIAETWGCSEGTVKNHASSILSKLGVRDRTRTVLRGPELGMN